MSYFGSELFFFGGHYTVTLSEPVSYARTCVCLCERAHSAGGGGGGGVPNRLRHICAFSRRIKAAAKMPKKSMQPTCFLLPSVALQIRPSPCCRSPSLSLSFISSSPARAPAFSLPALLKMEASVRCIFKTARRVDLSGRRCLASPWGAPMSP